MKPMIANQWELGVKGNLWRNRINFTVGYYNILVDNIHRGISVVRDGKEYNIIVQDGTQRSRGIEIETIMNPIQGLNIMAEYTYNHSKFEKANADVEGRRPESAGPANIFNSWISYILPIKGFEGFGIGFGVNRIGKQLAEIK